MFEAERKGFRTGFAVLIGRPNVGKSTLLNVLVGEKVSIVTPRPQTTRHRIMGLVNRPGLQIAFFDTPGLHAGGKRALNRVMNRTAAAALSDADLVVFVVEGSRWTEEDEAVMQRIRDSDRPTIAVVSKADLARPRETLLPFIQKLAEHHPFKAIVPVSAAQKDNLEELISVIGCELPQSPQLFDETDRTDRDLHFRIAEIIREKLTLELNQEVPYGIAVEIERMEREVDKGSERELIHAVIWVDREGQKPIVIGTGGARLKRVGSSARREIITLLDRRCHLELWVKVRENWADNALALRKLGLG
ncbi:MAG: GTPase Era [Gammaproteobacteria bacterium]|nr:GTPase Era [Gammaproteobacteria bacterium]